MKKLLLFFVMLLAGFTVKAQCDLPPQFDGNTGNNMTVMLTSAVFGALDIMSEDAYIVAVNDGLVVGSIPAFGITQTSLAVWGDDTSTLSEVDGALTGTQVDLFLVDGESLYSIVPEPAL